MNGSPPLSDALLVHAAFVRRVASALAGPQAGDDLSQDTWVAALERPPADTSAVGGWLATVTRNLFRNQRRAAARRAAREQRAAVDRAVPAVDEIVAREELRRRVVDAVLALPAEQREVVLLRYYEDLDSAAIGARLGRPAGTVRWQLHNAVQSLRRELDRAHGGRSAWTGPLLWWQRARLGRLAPLLRITWPVRAAVGTILLLGVAWFALPGLFGAPPPPPTAVPLPIAASPTQRDDAAPAANERQSVSPGAVADARIGPEELRGVVLRAADGATVGDADVQLQLCEADEFSKSLDHDYARQLTTLARVRSDREGRFAFPVERARLHRLRVQAAGCAPATSFECVGGSEVTIRVAAGARLDGVVREQAGGQPVADALVEVQARDPHLELGSTRTLVDGTFSFTALPPVAIAVSASHGRFASGSERLDLQAGSAREVAIELAVGKTASGRVTDSATGAPIAGADVSDEHSFDRHVARTDADGRYRLPGLDAERGQLLFARADGYCMHWGMQDEFGRDMARDIALVRGGSVRGRFVAANGAAMGNVFAGAGVSFEISIGEATDWRRAAVDGEGRFRIDGLAPSMQYSLYVRGSGFGTRVLGLPRQVPSGDVMDLGDIMLRPGGSLVGQVVATDGKAIAGAEVHLQGLDDGAWDLTGKRIESLEVNEFMSRERRSRSDGAFVFGGLARGNYRLLVRIPGHDWNAEFGPYQVEDGVDREGMRLAIDFGRVITGTLRRADGNALPADPPVILMALHAGTRQGSRVASDGSFRFDRLADVSYDICAYRAPAGWALPLQHGVAVNTEGLRLVLEPAATIEGRVVDARDRPCRTRVICWFAFGGLDYPTDADGRFHVEVAPDFAGKLTASGDDASAEAVLENVAAGAKDVVLRLQ